LDKRLQTEINKNNENLLFRIYCMNDC